jgi:ubiquitin carboxyl-terminal hydrolase 4/11/15
VTGSKPGAIENEGIVEADQYIPGNFALKHSLLENTDYEILCAPAWLTLKSWYGGGPEIARSVVKTNAYSVTPYQVELRPLGIEAMRSSNKEKKVRMRFSRVTTVKDAREALCKALGVSTADVRMWDYHGNSRYKMLDSDERTLEQAQIIENNPILLEEKNADGTWPPMPSYANSYATTGGLYDGGYDAGTSSS